VYPARYRIPERSLSGLHQEEKIVRAESFALGSLLYEVYSGKQLFDGLSDKDIQLHYAEGIFPDDVQSLQQWPAIFLYWSLDIAKEFSKMSTY
jgi:hypothetical protein